MSELGRPRKEIDWHLLESLAPLDAQLNYCAERQLIKWGEEPSAKTIKAAREVIERRIHERFELTFTEYKKEKMEPVRLKLRQKQIEIAMAGNVSMLIWLGKQYLGQSEKVESKVQTTESRLVVEFTKEEGGDLNGEENEEKGEG